MDNFIKCSNVGGGLQPFAYLFFQMRKDALPRGLRNRVFSLLIEYRSRSVACKLTGHLIEFVHSWKNTKFVCFFSCFLMRSPFVDFKIWIYFTKIFNSNKFKKKTFT